VTGLRTALWRCDIGDKLPLLASLRLSESDPKQKYRASFAPHLIEYSVIPASPQSAAAAGLNVFSDIQNCVGLLMGQVWAEVRACMIHEHFCCNHEFAAATSLRRAGSPLATSTYCFKYASLSRGSACPSRDATARFRDEPS
jgi:hypothetical protein